MSELPSSIRNISQLNYHSGVSSSLSRQGSRRQRRSDQRKSRRRQSNNANANCRTNRAYSSDDDADREMSDVASKVQNAVTISRNLNYKPRSTYSSGSDTGNDASSHSPRSSSNEVKIT